MTGLHPEQPEAAVDRLSSNLEINRRLGKRCFLLLARAVLGWAALCGAGSLPAATVETNSASGLRAKYVALDDQLKNNPFQRKLSLDSTESPGALQGDIYAEVEHPFAAFNAAFKGPENWCDVLILHINTKYCHASTDKAGTLLAVSIGKKYDQPLEDAYRAEFSFRVASATADYLDVRLNAEVGPMGTSDYRILLEAIPVGHGRTFLHLTYSYSYGMAGALAMQAYLATAGYGKRGFTVVGRLPDGSPDYIRGVRGVIERNTMRYCLAIDAYLGALAEPPAKQLEKRLAGWFGSAERYPRQLHEIDLTAYLAMKRREYLRQQMPQSR